MTNTKLLLQASRQLANVKLALAIGAPEWAKDDALREAMSFLRRANRRIQVHAQKCEKPATSG